MTKSDCPYSRQHFPFLDHGQDVRAVVLTGKALWTGPRAYEGKKIRILEYPGPSFFFEFGLARVLSII